MKKSIGILITAILLFTAACGLSEEESSLKYFTPQLTNSVTSASSMEMDSALNIITSKEKRAILTVCLAIDFSVTDEGKEFMNENIALFLHNDSYVSSNGTNLYVTGYANEKYLTICYAPGLDIAGYAVLDTGVSSAGMAFVVKEVAESQTFHYKNDTSDLADVLKILADAAD